ncbi:helix-turn-helix transcriptional regulator [Microlunatus speluncae]|uniref:helix-turn-helix transcriptional regulator n=1 Tax=Microlunatus speluncae TaxID=2594267 RepID=UPI00126616B9|nr:WYL domain-containing protein [Microlunatus speluncae]
MLTTSIRLLRLLSLLQTRQHWSGAELAAKLGVARRTLRNDIDRLRRLGYPVHASPGVGGGYGLAPGATLPPLLLDNEEAVAVAVGLRTAAAGAVTGMEEPSVRALAKLELMLPSPLRRRINGMQRYTVAIADDGPLAAPAVDPSVLTALIAVCRDHERLRFDLATKDGTTTRRTVEPFRLVNLGGRWYLVAFDLDAADWRTFLVERMTLRVPTGPRFVPRPPPPEGLIEQVTRGAATATWEYRARVRIHAPMAVVAARLPRTAGSLTPVDDDSCDLDSGADDPATMLRYLSMLDLDFSVPEAPELAAEVRKLAARYTRAAP